MKENDKEQELLKNIKRALDEGSETIDAKTLSRLTQARYHALQSTRPNWFARHRWFRAPAAAFLLAVVLVFISTFYVTKTTNDVFLDSLEDVEILTASDSPDFYADLDFYMWLSDEENNAG